MRRVAGLVVLSLAGCAAVGGVNDGTSLSRGGSSEGALINAVRLPVKGDGYEIPRTWSARGLNWGTEELVSLVVRASRRVAKEAPGSTLYVADMSPRRGGPSAWHRSHQSGRDADILFFAIDDKGNPAAPPAAMITYGDDGCTPATDDAGNPIARVCIDVARNWALVRALVEDEGADVQYLFIYEPLKQMLLAYAAQQGEPEELVARAEALLHQPGDSLPHDDHLHVRIYCPAGDRALGCKDRGPLRWFKKSYKYLANRGLFAGAPDPAHAQFCWPFCRLVSARTLAYL
jgi:penicillin-insensitive murein DD-endopeptidase